MERQEGPRRGVLATVPGYAAALGNLLHVSPKQLGLPRSPWLPLLYAETPSCPREGGRPRR